MNIIFLWLMQILLITFILVSFGNEIKRFVRRRNKVKIFVDSMHSTIYVSPAKKTTDEELKNIINKYNDNYEVKIVDTNTEISGITKYVVDYTRNKKRQ
ncbi:hypothetical protein AABC03_01150 [Staphylococcus nepalensis]